MKITVEKALLRRALRWAQWVLGAVAVVMLGYCGVVLTDSWLFQQKERRHLEKLLHDGLAAGRQVGRVSPPVSSKIRAVLAHGDLIGRLEIPRLSLSVIVAEGIDARTLRRAVGHIPGTGMPGAPGNIGLSGHRDTFFRPLRNIQPDDIVTLTTPAGEYRYRVVSTRIVDSSAVGVLNPNGGETLTLVTCYPFYFVGPAPRRFIVRAERTA